MARAKEELELEVVLRARESLDFYPSVGVLKAGEGGSRFLCAWNPVTKAIG